MKNCSPIQDKTKKNNFFKDGNVVTRSNSISLKQVESNENQFKLSFSSEEPYERYFGAEILDHTVESVDLKRLSEIGVLLFNHQRNSILGKIVHVEVENNRGTATVEFDDEDEFAQSIKRKIDKGILKGVSVGYSVSKWEHVEKHEKSEDGRFNGPCYIAKKWEPVEVSIVSVPADASVGVGRDYINITEEDEKLKKKDYIDEKDVLLENEDDKKDLMLEAEIDEDEIREQVKQEEQERQLQIRTLCKEFDIDPDDYIEKNLSLDETRKAVLDSLKTTREPLNVKIISDEKDNLRNLISESLLLRSGVKSESTKKEVLRYSHMSLKDIMNTCARVDGISNPERMNPDELIRQYLTPSSVFASIVDQTIKSSYEEGYRKADATFDIWASKGTLSDFKPVKSYTIHGAGDLLLVPEGGELKHDTFSGSVRPERKLETYGRQFSMTRQGIVNNDIDIITKMPFSYAISSKRTINKQVYKLLADNPIIYDGIALFDATKHKNLITPGAKPSKEAIQQMLVSMAKQVDENGDAIVVNAKYVLCPIGLSYDVLEVLGSQTISFNDNGVVSSMKNPLFNRGLEVIEEGSLNILNANGEFEWYMVADKNSASTIQVDYLNGQEMPTIVMHDKPGQLGFIWDIYHDWSITLMDYRGLIKNEGK